MQENKAGKQAWFCFKLAIIICCMMWPTSADLSDFQPFVKHSLPADIMRVEFADETWIYRLYEDGTVKKVTSERTGDATRSWRETAGCMQEARIGQKITTVSPDPAC